MEVPGELVNDLGTPPSLILALQNVAAGLPVEQNQLTVNGERRPQLGLADALL